MTSGTPVVGTADHARIVTHGRHPGVHTAMAWLAFSHLPGALQDLSRPLYLAAMDLLIRIPNDTAELATALNRLVEAKDWFVRAGIHSDQGAPGPVPRPATVVDPPSITGVRDEGRGITGMRGPIPPWREPYPTTPAETRDGGWAGEKA